MERPVIEVYNNEIHISEVKNTVRTYEDAFSSASRTKLPITPLVSRPTVTDFAALETVEPLGCTAVAMFELC
jgi:hypothetical protein